MIAFLRPDAWDFPLFVHVLGATVLFGGVASVALVSWAGQRNPAHAPLLRTLAFRTTLFVVWPAFILMRAGAQWIYNKENLDPDFPRWIAIGVGVGDGGILVLLILTLLGWLALRRANVARWFTALAGLYLIALAVAWYAMSAKPGA